MTAPASARRTALDVDLLFAVLLTVLALVGYATVFDGTSYLVAGLGGVVAGTAVAVVAGRLRLPAVVGIVGAGVVFVLVGPALIGEGPVPIPAAVGGLVDGVLRGWKRLVTVAPPVSTEGHVLAVPFASGFLGAGAALALARAWPKVPLCLLPPIAALIVSVLLGTNEPASLLLQGAAFTAGVVGWLAVRDARRRNVVVQATSARRRLTGAAIVAGTVAAALVVGPALPGAADADRYVLRDEVQPQFDPRQYPSPLAGYRRFLGERWNEEALLEARGLPPGTSVRLAVMDGYDGVVWRVSGDGATGIFERPGARVDEATAEATEVELRSAGLSSVWVPTVGDVQAIDFDGEREEDLDSSLRFNRQSETAASPLFLRPGDRYRLQAVLPKEPSEAVLATAAADARFLAPAPAELPTELKKKATQIVGETRSPYEQAKALEAWFQQGYYSDGGPNTAVPPGHSLFRLATFLELPAPVGNGEQYAAAMAVLARQLGLPARVVMGYRVADDSPEVIRGKDVDAWVEVAFDRVGWVSFRPTPDKSRIPQEQTAPKPKAQTADVQSPPVSNPAPPPTLGPTDGDRRPEAEDELDGFRLPGFVVAVVKYVGTPLLVVLAVLAVIVALKRRRRGRRRTGGKPAQRISGGWEEVLDVARDLRRPVPAKTTRLEASAAIDAERLRALAAQVDASVFGQDNPSDADADAIWKQVDSAIQELLAPLGRRERVLAAVNPASLRPER